VNGFDFPRYFLVGSSVVRVWSTTDSNAPVERWENGAWVILPATGGGVAGEHDAHEMILQRKYS
jgi:hypothetical protein